MSVSVGDDILASQFNNLRSTINQILAQNYGQSMRSSAAQSNSTVISSNLKRDLFLDIQRVQVHQTGSLNNSVFVPPAGVTIAADTSQNFNQSTGATSSVSSGNLMGFNNYNSAVNTVSNFNPSSPNIWPAENFTLGSALTSNRSEQWGGDGQVQSVYHIITFVFGSQAARNHYFNAGGELRFSASLTGTSGSKGSNWSTMLSSMGTIRFSKWRSTASSGTPNSSGSGFDSLSGSYRTIFIKTGSGVYSDNEYIIDARIESSTTLRFRIRFNDAYEGTGNPSFPEVPGTDEPVTGTLSSSANTFRPNSSFVFDSQNISAVNLPAPSRSTQVALTANNSGIPS